MGVWTDMSDAGRVLTHPRAGTLGVLLLVERLKQGFTLRQLGQQAGFSGSYVNDLERGRRDAPIATVIRLANALGVDPDPMIEAMLRESEPEMMAWVERRLAAERRRAAG